MTTQTIQIEALTIPQLVALYNEHAETPVKKFADRKTAIKRVTDLIQTTNATQQEIETMTAMNNETAAFESFKNLIAFGGPGVTYEQANAAQIASQQVETKRALDASDPVETQEVETLPEITDLEHLVLLGVAESDYQDGHDPEDEKLVWSWSATGYLSSKKSAGALVASLVKKGLLKHSPRHGDEDECIGFTKLGAAVYRAKVEKAPLPTIEKPKRERKAKAEKVETQAHGTPASFSAWFDAMFQPVATQEQKAKRAKKEKAEKPAREPSKAQIMFNMIQQEGGALKSELLKVCGWKGCAVSLGRACEKAGLTFVKTKREDGDWTYSAVAKA